MALPTFKARIALDRSSLSGRDTYTIELFLDVWTGTEYGRSTPFLFDTGAEATTITAAMARELGLSTVGGRRVNMRGASGKVAGILIPFRFRFTAWPDLEVTDSVCVVIPGEKELGLLGLRDVHPRLEFFKLGNDLFFVPPPPNPPSV
jgi:predicted aspartyl protease